jgi:hypothetical protein
MSFPSHSSRALCLQTARLDGTRVPCHFVNVFLAVGGVDKDHIEILWDAL